MDQLNSIDEAIISKEIKELMNFLLDSIVNSIIFIINQFTKSIDRRNENPNLAINHAIAFKILKSMIHRYPFFLLYLVDYKISNEIFEKYYQSFSYLNERFKEKFQFNHQNINFIDFLFYTYPFNGMISKEIFFILFSNNYYYEMKELNGIKYLCSSSNLWKYEILFRILAEYKRILDSKKITKDLNCFLEMYNLNIITIELLIYYNKSSKAFLMFDEIFTNKLYKVCLQIIKEFNSSNGNLCLLRIKGVFYFLCKKAHDRIIKISILKKLIAFNHKKKLINCFKFLPILTSY